MKNRLILVVMILALAAVACNLPSLVQKTPTTEPTPTPDFGMQTYYGAGMQILLPPTYVARDIQEDLPDILATVKSALGEGNSTLATLVENLEGNVAWWGYDSAAPAISPTRLLIIKNEELEKLPVNLISGAIGAFLGTNTSALETDKLDLAGRDVTRFSYSQENSAWAGYVFKEQGMLWLVLFLTPPANLAAQTQYFEYSVASMVIDPAVPTQQP